jgi:hypothetical protein
MSSTTLPDFFTIAKNENVALLEEYKIIFNSIRTVPVAN